MKKTLFFFSLLLVAVLSFALTGCNDVPTEVERYQPEPDGIKILLDGMPPANGVFTVQKNLTANFTCVVTGNFSTGRRWYPKYNSDTTLSFFFNHNDFSYYWTQNGMYTLKLRAYRSDNTYRDTTYSVLVVDSIPGGTDTTYVPFKPAGSSFDNSSQMWTYHFKFGARFATLPQGHIYRPWWVVRTETSFIGMEITGNGLDTTDGYYDVSIRTFDTLLTVHWGKSFNPNQPASSWDYANILSSTYLRTLPDGSKYIQVGLKNGGWMLWNAFSYDRPGNQGDDFWRWESSGNNRLIYGDIRGLSFDNTNQLWWASNLSGMNFGTPTYGVQVLSSGYCKLTVPLGGIPVADSGTVYIKQGRDWPNLNPSIMSSGMYRYFHPNYNQWCLRFQFFQGLDKPNGNKTRR